MCEIQELNEDDVTIKFTTQEITLIKMIIGKFHPENSEIITNLWSELDDAGIEEYENVFILNQNEPVLHIVVQDTK